MVDAIAILQEAYLRCRTPQRNLACASTSMIRRTYRSSSRRGSQCRAEELGFAGVGMPDHPHTGRDVFVRLTLAAQRTERVTLFPSVANPVSRDPRMLATLAATLGELAPGRARLVVGSGQNAVQYVGVPGATVSQMAATTETVRRTLATEFALEPPVPVYINGSSPRMLEAAGAAADGFLCDGRLSTLTLWPQL